MTAGQPKPPDSPLAVALADAGGVQAPPERAGQLRSLLLDELRAGADELKRPRSGYERPVVVAVAANAYGLLGVTPVDPALRADPGAVREREWLVIAALVGAMVDAGAPAVRKRWDGHRAHGDAAPRMLIGDLAGWLVLALPVAGSDAVHAAEAAEAAELAALGFEEHAGRIDRLRARAYALPALALDGVADLRPPIGDAHPLRVAEAIARLGGAPADERSVAEHEEGVLALLGAPDGPVRPHEERDPALRVARRILQRLAGMGKWGGYHTDVAHLPRGFAGHDRALAIDVGERLLASGLLLEKQSVGQRHVYLNSRRAGAIYALVERGELPDGLVLG
jgi:hypothetical protein